MRSTRSPGNSGQPLARKLGVVAGTRIAAPGAPPHYRSLLAPLPRGVVWTTQPQTADVVHCFFEQPRALESRIASLAAALRDEAALWISWPKQTSGRASDLTGDVLRAVILPHGLVDVKVCAVDETWSGLKFVRRLGNRSKQGPA